MSGKCIYSFKRDKLVVIIQITWHVSASLGHNQTFHQHELTTLYIFAVYVCINKNKKKTPWF
jgi:hypothetical protein